MMGLKDEDQEETGREKNFTTLLQYYNKDMPIAKANVKMKIYAFSGIILCCYLDQNR